MVTQPGPRSAMARLLDAMNQHDIDAFLDCFDPDYLSEQPIHPERTFTGREQVRKNWSALFTSVPGLHSELIRLVEDGNTEWAEWHWAGLRLDGTQFEMRGMTVSGIQDGRVKWQRLYMEEVEKAGAGIDSVVRNLTHEAPKQG